MQLVGIPLDSSSNSSKLLHYWSIGFGSLSFLLNVTANMWALVIAKRPVSTEHWNDLIGAVNFAFGTVLVHAGLLISVGPSWKKIAAILNAIDHLKLFQLEDYLKCRKICFYGRIAFTAMVKNNSNFFKV